MKHKRVAVSALFALALVASTLLATSAHAEAVADNSSGATSSTETVGDANALSPSEKKLFYSNDRKQIEVDATSGDIVSVTPLTQEQLQSLIDANQPTSAFTETRLGAAPLGVSTGCPLTWFGCWYGKSSAYVNYQFTNGVTSGTWTSRQNFYTGTYYAKLCWLDPANTKKTFCMAERNGTNAWITLGQAVTGKKVDLSPTRV
ncbi:hypothetical protein [Microbacterium luticocti]|uniref:hypothetical protein n=1 Tax=Microbacterium luticocti TaxID=451764 RepID=UPI000490B6B5|nr:hypothetical protein [Microbacterium luticocti]